MTRKGFDPEALSSAQASQLERALADATIVASAAVSTTAVKVNGWDSIMIDRYGYNYPLRAVHSGPYLGGNMARTSTPMGIH